jgi:hypothetical protein
MEQQMEAQSNYDSSGVFHDLQVIAAKISCIQFLHFSHSCAERKHLVV